MKIDKAVHLFRLLNNKECYNETEVSFSGEGCYSLVFRDEIQALSNNNYISFDELAVNKISYDLNKLPPANEDLCFDFNISISQCDTISFYQNFKCFFERASTSLVNGILPEEFYIVDDDYYSCDNVENEKVRRLKTILELSRCLTSVANHVEESSDGLSKTLIFFTKKTDKVNSESLKISFDNIELLDYELNLALCLNICIENDDSLFFNEKRIIFTETILEFIESIDEENEKFSYLIKNWNQFLSLLKKNIHAYISSFSFQKIRQEVANAEIDFSAKCSKVLSDIQAKLLGIPVSLAGVVVLTKANYGFEIILLSIGLVFTSLILYSTVKVQLSNFNIIKSASKNVFDGFQSRYKTYPDTLKTMIDDEKTKIEKQQKRTFRWLIAFLVFSLAPAFLSILFLISKIWFSSIAIIIIS